MLNKNWKRSALVLMLMASVWGCAQPKLVTIDDQVRTRYGQMDEFDVLLLRAGVDLTEFPAQESWTVEQASDLVQLLRFKISDGNMSAYGPRILASFLLEEDLKTGKAILRRALIERLHTFNQLAVLTPEGHLVKAHTGTVLRCVGPLHIRDGVPQAGGFKVDAFYVPKGDTFSEEPNLAAPAIFIPPPPSPPAQQLAGAEAK